MPARSVITLLTDFGTTDSYVAEVKGVLLTAAPDATIVDVTHDIPPGDVSAARYVLGRVWHRFPSGTVHLVVVDPGVGSSRRALALRAGGHYFVGPDNGVLTPALPGTECVTLPVPTDASPTFHGRDVFAPAAAALATGKRLGALGARADECIRHDEPVARLADAAVTGVVVLVDRFGNLITNVPDAMLAAGGIVHVGSRPVGPLRRTFADVPPGAPVAYVGSGGTLEVAVRDGSAAMSLGAGPGTVVRLERC